jgi:hypothetical protein
LYAPEAEPQPLIAFANARAFRHDTLSAVGRPCLCRYCNFAYSALASFRMEMFGSASFHARENLCRQRERECGSRVSYDPVRGAGGQVSGVHAIRSKFPPSPVSVSGFLSRFPLVHTEVPCELSYQVKGHTAEKLLVFRIENENYKMVG